MTDKKIRLLRAEEIECRVDSIYENGITLLLYKDARVDQNVLDETFGMCGWKREHMMLGDSMFCSVSIRTDEGEWITKQDVGSASYAEPVKGAASDAFKRACVNIGIGRELYTAPFIWVPSDKVEIRIENGKRKVKERFHVSDIQYNEEKRVITGVVIKNSRDEVVYSSRIKGKKTASDKTKCKDELITWEQEEILRTEMYRKGVTEEAICQRYLVKRLQDMDVKTYERAMKALKASKGVAA